MIVLGWRTGSERVYSRRTSISEVRLTGRAPALRACITSYRSTQADVDVLMEELQGALTVASDRA